MSDRLCVELCSGYGTLSEAFVRAGWGVIRVDNDPRFSFVPYTQIHDARDWRFVRQMIGTQEIDFLLITPPCNCFSVASMGHHWTGGVRAYQPKTEEAARSVDLVRSLLEAADALRPRYLVMENPRAMLRKIIPERLAGTVWLCQYGDKRAKPTDLFGILPPAFEFKTCRNGAKDHEEARRGAKTGTQGIDGAGRRAKMPLGLSKALLESYYASPIPMEIAA